ncbi:hypothetical protein BU24DRAFT_162893 [Aaosphaeria arxii CBS 175.79]|uniref:Uncharacterized protein n=1 Tax=Aaosphaeria arxii CBS 175.79 TaxID=1450172 RepID=A0A6A5Y096_9PLEO|nr:uncharacterized protein BU24DRAFT_162893 [Aaosphaeria arxii CBS 175.79]KAF2017984.1 hypothetical protein BU24DRAFT_162893 [Aaosphaeria arxii CBS 175.79]
MLAWLPCRCCVYEWTVDAADEGREMSNPMEGSCCLSTSRWRLLLVEDAVLKDGRSSTCKIDGRRNDSRANGRGRIVVASAEAVVAVVGQEKRWASASLFYCWVVGFDEGVVVTAARLLLSSIVRWSVRARDGSKKGYYDCGLRLELQEYVDGISTEKDRITGD